MEVLENSILKIYASSTDRIGQELLYEKIVLNALNKGMSGATVYRGIMGFGSSSKVSSSKFWELTEKLPVVIEIIDQTIKVEAFYNSIYQELLNMSKGCIVTMEPINLLFHKTGKSK